MANTTYTLTVPASPTSVVQQQGTAVGNAKKEKRTFAMVAPVQGDVVVILGSQDNTNFSPISDANGQIVELTYGTPVRTLDDNSLYYHTLRTGFGAGSTLQSVAVCGEDLTASGSTLTSTPVTSGSYSVGPNDTSIDVNFNGAVVISLPAPTVGRILRIRDVGGFAAPTQPIQISPANGTTIEAQNGIAITAAYGYVELYGASATVWTVTSRTRNSTPVQTGANYNAGSFDDIIPVDSTSGAVQVTLPGAPLIGEQHTIYDSSGQAQTNNITVSRNGKTINGQAVNAVIDSLRGHVTLVWLGTTWATLDNLSGSLWYPGLVSVANAAGGGSIGAASATVDVAGIAEVNQTTANQARTIPAPTVTAHGRFFTVVNVGTAAFFIGDAALAQNFQLFPGQAATFAWNGSNWIPVSGYTQAPTLGGTKNSTGNVQRVAQFSLFNITSLGGAVTLTLVTTGANAGDVIALSRTDTSANAVTVANGGGGGGTLTTMPASKAGFARFWYDGTNWNLEAAASQ